MSIYYIYISYIEMNHDDYVCSKSKIILTIILTNDIMFLWKYIVSYLSDPSNSRINFQTNFVPLEI